MGRPKLPGDDALKRKRERDRVRYLGDKVAAKDRQDLWRKTPEGVYSAQKRKAKQRGVTWEFTFATWWRVWQESGKWEQRGATGDKYCMCRLGDVGPYSVENVRIDTFSNNTKERYLLLGVDIEGKFNERR